MKAGLLALFVCLSVASQPGAAGAQVSLGDRWWTARAEGLQHAKSSPETIERAIVAYRRAQHDDLDDPIARWKLLRALHYVAEFTNAAESRKDEAIEEAIVLARNRPVGAIPAGERADQAQLHFWSAIAWGARGQRVGLLTIVREGVAGRLHDHAVQAVELDASIERGGGYRLLSRLHGTLPKLPFLSGWVDRSKTLPLAERAHSIDPADPGNQLVLAMALLEHAPERREEARGMLLQAAEAPPRPELVAEELAIRDQARELLADPDER